MLKKTFIILTILFLIVGIASFAISAIGQHSKDDNLYKQVELFSDALGYIQSEYVEEATPKDLIYGALRGMLDSLDPHSQFLDPQEYIDLKTETEGKFGGIGIEVTLKDRLLTVVAPIEDSPAWKVGIKSGDRIVKIDGEITRGINLNDAVKKLRGKPNTEVTLTIWREGSEKLLDFKITRDMIKVEDIKDVKILEDNIGYIRIVEFRETTPSDLGNALSKLKSQGMDSLIIDLRNNPGGLLEIAIKATEMFVEPGKIICYTKGRSSNQNLEFKSRDKSPYLDLPLVVLVNEGSASGSEIVAGCLQDYKRAIILGTKTFGKGSVQTVIPLSDGSALRLTTSKYFTPSGKVIHEKGIEPDIVVEQIVLQKTNTQTKKSEDIFENIEEKKEEEIPKDYQSDNQLVRAIDLLKGIKVYQKTRNEPR